MAFPGRHVEVGSLIGSWPVIPSAVSGVPTIMPRTMLQKATIIGILREPAAGYDVDARSFVLNVDGVDKNINFSYGAFLPLSEVISQINADAGATVAFNDNGFLKLQSPTLGGSSYLKLKVDPASSPTNVFLNLGLFPETESFAGELVPAQHVDPDRQVASPGQMTMSEGENFEARVFNRAVAQLAFNNDRHEGLLSKKRVAARTTHAVASYAMPGAVHGVQLSGGKLVYVGKTSTPGISALEALFALLDSEGRELSKDIYVVDASGWTGNFSTDAYGRVSVTSSFFNAVSESTYERGSYYVIATGLIGGASGMNGKPMKILDVRSGLGASSSAHVEVIDPSTGAKVTITQAGVNFSVVIRKRAKAVVDGVFENVTTATAGTPRLENLQVTKRTGLVPTRIELGNRLVFVGENFNSSPAIKVGDLVTWSGSTIETPFVNNGSYRVDKIIDRETIQVVAADWSAALLNPNLTGGTVGTIDIKTDGAFVLDPFLRFRNDSTYVAPSTGDAFDIAYLGGTSIRQASDDNPALFQSDVRYDQEADETVARAITRMWGPSATTVDDVLYGDYRINIEGTHDRLRFEHYYDEAGPDGLNQHFGRHKNIRPDSIDIFPNGTTTPFKMRDAANQVTGTWYSSGALDHYNNHTQTAFGAAGTNHYQRFARGTYSAPTVVTDGDRLGSWILSGYDGSGYQIGARIDARVDGTPGPSDMPTRLDFLTSPDGSATPIERMRITNQGLVNIGGRGSVTTAARLHVIDDSTSGALAISEHIAGTDIDTWYVRRARGAFGGLTAVSSGDTVGSFRFTGYDGSSYQPAAYLRVAVDGTSGASDMPGRFEFHTTLDGTATLVERMRIDNTGLMNIGGQGTITTGAQRFMAISSSTGSPNTIFEHINNADADLLVIRRSRGTLSSRTVVAAGDLLGNMAFLGYDGSAYRTAAAIVSYVDGTPGASDMPGRLGFFTTSDGSATPVERLRIGANGYVGINTRNLSSGLPQAGFHFVGDGTTQDDIYFDRYSASLGPYMVLRRSRGTPGALTDVSSGDAAGSILYRANYGGTFYDLAMISGIVDGTPGASDMPGRLIFLTTPDGSSTLSERMRIDNAGRLSYATGGTVDTNAFVHFGLAGSILRVGKTSGADTSGGHLEVLSNRNDGNLTFGGRIGLAHWRSQALSYPASGILGAVYFGGPHGTNSTWTEGNNLYSAMIAAFTSETRSSASNLGTILVFNTATAATASMGRTLTEVNAHPGVERMRIDDAGRVSINQPTIPTGNTLHVRNIQASVTSQRVVEIRSPNITDTHTHFISFGKADSSNNTGEIGWYHGADASATNALTFGCYGSTSLYVNAGGRVGVGVNPDTYKFHVAGSTNLNWDTGKTYEYFRASNPTGIGAGKVHISGDCYGGMYLNSSTYWGSPMAHIRLSGAADKGAPDNNHDCWIEFWTKEEATTKTSWDYGGYIGNIYAYGLIMSCAHNYQDLHLAAGSYWYAYANAYTMMDYAIFRFCDGDEYNGSGKIIAEINANPTSVTQLKLYRSGSTTTSGQIYIAGGYNADPATNAGGVWLYSKKPGAHCDLYVRDGAGTITLLGPHDDKGTWVFDSKNTKTGIRKHVNMEKLVALVEKLSGEKLMEIFQEAAED